MPPHLAATTHSLRPSRVISTLAVLLLAVFSAGCGGSDATTESIPAAKYRYAADAEMTATLAETAARDIVIRCPAGWRETVDQKNAPNIVLWIVAENYGASLSFVPLQMDPVLYTALRRDGLSAVAKVSLSLKRDNARDSVRVLQPPESFTLNRRDYVAYEYSADGGKTAIRVVLFDTGRQYIECALLPATQPVTPDENRRLFSVQQSVLASMVVK
ncbi:MAG: hypothetical protein IPP94_09840 [Ignavibacteria bacterium]|nr:hypothetical protein [Ignavibacteria bacterium]